MKNLLVTILFSTLMIGCSSSVKIKPENRVDSSKINAHSETIKLNEPVLGELDEKDFVISMDKAYTGKDSKQKDVSPYDTPVECYKINIKPGKYHIKMISIGNFFGFDKRLMIPMIKLSDSDGANINVELNSSSILGPDMSYGCHLEEYFDVEVAKEGEYYLLVYADMDMSPTRSIIALWPVAGIANFHDEENVVISQAGGKKTSFIFKKGPFSKYKMLISDSLEKTSDFE